MSFLKRIFGSRSGRNVAATYFNFVSLVAFGFISIPMAVAYLEREEIGLWAVTTSVVSYLMWMGQGVGEATSRLIAPSIAAADQNEINRWWTASQMALVVQGALIVVVGLAVRPFIVHFFDLSDQLVGTANQVLFWAVLLLGIGMPIKGSTSVLTAQERYHLSQLIQGFSLWVQLVAFYLLLRGNFGIMAYVWASWLAQATALTLFVLVLRGGPNPPRFRPRLVDAKSFGSIFRFGANVSVQGFVEAAFNTLPTMVLAKFGGLAMAPIYTFSSRGPQQLATLARKIAWAFYPRLLRIQVTGQKEVFARKHRQVATLIWGCSLFAAGGVLGFNQMLVEFLSAPDFFAGPVVNSVLAAVLILEPTSRIYQCLLPASGQMKGVAILCLVTLGIAVGLSVPAFRSLGLGGLTAILILLPLAMSFYGYRVGGRNCGFRPGELSLRPAGYAALTALAALVAGPVMALGGTTGLPVEIMGRATHLPDWPHLLVGSVFMAGGAVVGYRTVRSLAG